MSTSIAPSRSLAAAAAAFGLAPLVLVSACHRQAAQPAAPPAPPPKITVPPVEIPKLPAPVVLDRAGLIKAAADAASAYAEGQTATQDDPLVGQQFSIRLAFGCTGPTTTPDGGGAPEGLAGWSWDAKHKAIELSLAPGDWIASPLIAAPDTRWEAAEGFWITRPWMRADGCPKVEADPLASGTPVPSPQTVGLAAMFEKGSSRVGRRNGRAYTFTVRGDAGKPPVPPPGAYRVLLQGRLIAMSDGRAIRCRAANPDQRPVCVAAAQLDRVAFEDDTGDVLSEWRMD